MTLILIGLAQFPGQAQAAVFPPLEIKVKVTIEFNAGSYAGSTIDVPGRVDICAPAGNQVPSVVCDIPYEVDWVVEFVTPGDRCGPNEDDCQVVMETKRPNRMNGRLYSRKDLTKGNNSVGVPNTRARYNPVRRRSFQYSLEAFDMSGTSIKLRDPEIMPNKP